MINYLREIVCLLMLAGASLAQSTNGTITGTVRDSSGLAIAGAKVRLVQVATGVDRAGASNELGIFTFPSVVAGEYNVFVSAAGFKGVERKGVNLLATETLALGEFKLEVGATTDSVTVTTQGASVQTASSERSGTVTTAQVENLAVRGRNVPSLAKLLPGVVMSSESDQVDISNGIRALGGRSSTNNMSLDGVPMNDIGNNNGYSVYVSMDSVAEVKILLGNFSAEYGRLSGANVQIVTKSGTKDFHGLGSYFKRHEEFNANNFFNNRIGAPIPRYRFNTYNYSIGGPAYIPGLFNKNKDKLFFFWSQEFWPIKTSGGLNTLTVPTALERTGDFSQTVDLNNAKIIVKDPNNGQPFANNIVPASRIDPSGQALLKVFPMPNFLDTSISARRYNYVFQEDTDNPKRTMTLRMDYNLSPKDMIYGSWSARKDDQTAALGLGTSGSTNWPQMVKTFYSQAQLSSIHYTRVISPTLVNEFGFGQATRPQGDRATQDQITKNQRASAGFKSGQFYTDHNPLDILPNATYGGVSLPANLFVEQRFPHIADHTILNFTDSLTKTWRGHTIKAGIYVDHFSTNRKIYGVFNGSYAFDRNANNPLDTGYAYSNGILGVFSSYTESSNLIFRQYRLHNVEWFAQDNWKINRKLTLDLGVRFYWAPPTTDTQNLFSGFDPAYFDPTKQPKLITPALVSGKRAGINPVTGQVFNVTLIGALAPGTGNPSNGMVTPASVSGYPKSLVENPGIHTAPRIGFAYDPFGDGKTAVRGGFGVFFNRETLDVSNPYAQQTPIVDNPIVYFSTLPSLLSQSGVLFPQDVYGIQRNGAGTPTVMNYSLSVQRNVGLGFVLDVGYVASLTRHQLWRRNVNAIPLGANFLAKNADPTVPNSPLSQAFLRPITGYNNILMSEWAGTSNYHSMQTTLNRRFSKSLDFGLAWTWSKAMTYTDSDTGEVSTLVNPRLWNYGLSSIDRTHIVNISWLYTLPKSKWRNSLSTAVLDGWQVSGIGSFISGAPATVGFSTTTAVDLTGTPNLGARINVSGNPNLSASDRTFSHNFNTSVFSLPAKGTFGNSAPTTLRAPGVSNFDISLFKSFKIHERFNAQFRAEAYNAFNHTQFSAFDTTARFDTTTGAQINTRLGEYTAARAARIMQMAIRVSF